MYNTLNQMLGLVFESIEASEYEIIFHAQSGQTFRMYHEQDCCEAVYVEDIAGDLADLINTPLLRAEERSQDDSDAHGSGAWTFYEFATIKGSATIRWYGSTDSCYSVSVSLEQLT